MAGSHDEAAPDERSVNLSQLITLSYVARFGSFSRAAEAMGISQPTVSQQIRDLEHRLGVSLVIAVGRGIKITDAGEALAEIGRRIALEREHALRVATSHLEGTAGRLTVAASFTTGTYIVPAVLARLSRSIPDAVIDLRVANTFDVAQMVSDDVVDLGVIEGHVDRPELLIKRFARDTLVCIAAPRFPGARDALTPADVRSYVLLVREDGSGTRQIVTEALAQRGFTFARIVSFGTNESIKAGVAEGLGIAWLSTLAVDTEIKAGRLRILSFDTPPVERDLSYVRRLDIKASPLGEAFLRELSTTRGT